MLDLDVTNQEWRRERSKYSELLHEFVRLKKLIKRFVFSST